MGARRRNKGDGRQETGDRIPETGSGDRNRRQEQKTGTGDRNRRQELETGTGDRRWERGEGDKRQETG